MDGKRVSIKNKVRFGVQRFRVERFKLYTFWFQRSAKPLAAEAVSLIEKETLALCYKSMLSYSTFRFPHSSNVVSHGG